MASRVVWLPRVRWLGQDEEEEPPPPMVAVMVPRDGRWTPGEKIMLAMLGVNAAWFAWSVARAQPINPNLM